MANTESRVVCPTSSWKNEFLCVWLDEFPEFLLHLLTFAFVDKAFFSTLLFNRAGASPYFKLQFLKYHFTMEGRVSLK